MANTFLSSGRAVPVGRLPGIVTSVGTPGDDDHVPTEAAVRTALTALAAANTLLTADPGSPPDDTWWVVREGSAPTEVSAKVRIGGVTYVLAALTLP